MNLGKNVLMSNAAATTWKMLILLSQRQRLNKHEQSPIKNNPPSSVEAGKKAGSFGGVMFRPAKIQTWDRAGNN